MQFADVRLGFCLRVIRSHGLLKRKPLRLFSWLCRACDTSSLPVFLQRRIDDSSSSTCFGIARIRAARHTALHVLQLDDRPS